MAILDQEPPRHPKRHFAQVGEVLIYAGPRAPRKRCITRKITAKTSSRWIIPPAMWKASHPTAHTPNKMKNKTRNRKSRITLFLALPDDQSEGASGRLNSTRLDAFRFMSISEILGRWYALRVFVLGCVISRAKGRAGLPGGRPYSREICDGCLLST